ncbi:putative O-unit flippase, partial [Yersinia pestis PY-36]
MFMS